VNVGSPFTTFRVQLSSKGMRVPRFNMPFETGLAIAFALRSNHQWRLFEEARYRLIQSLSDLNGFEPFIHGGTPAGILQALMDAFLERPAEEEQLVELFGLLLTYRRKFMGVRFFEPRPFRTLVRAAIETRKKALLVAS